MSIPPRVQAYASVQDCLHHHFTPGAGICCVWWPGPANKCQKDLPVCACSVLDCATWPYHNLTVEQYHWFTLTPGAVKCFTFVPPPLPFFHEATGTAMPRSKRHLQNSRPFQMASWSLTTVLWLPLWMEQDCISLWGKRSPWAAVGPRAGFLEGTKSDKRLYLAPSVFHRSWRPSSGLLPESLWCGKLTYHTPRFW